MLRFFLFPLLVVLLLLQPALAFAGANDCATVAVTDSLDIFVPIGSESPVDISFEPDALGSEVVAILSLQFCSRAVATACNDYDYDSDADGIPDTNLLDATTTTKSGVVGVVGFNYLRIQSATNPSGTDDPEVMICRSNKR